MTDLAALDALIEAVDGGVRLPMDGSAYRLFGDGWLDVFDAYHGSLDAALALHEALLQGWDWWSEKVDGRFFCSVKPENRKIWDDVSYADNPARSWLIAILKAYRAKVAG